MASSLPASAGAPKRKRPPPRPVTVEKVERIAPRITRVTFGGEALAGFGPPRPGGHIKLFFLPEGSDWTPQNTDAPRPPSRTYTPRRFDAERLLLDVEFVHHGHGLASTWAESAQVGEQMYVGGPGGGYDVPEDAGNVVLAADDTAIPAAGTILESLPGSCSVTTFCEVAVPEDERALSPTVDASPVWLRRSDENAIAGTLLENAVRELTSVPDTTHWWIACEALAMRRIRQHLLVDRKIDPALLHTRGYWRLGNENYPDHDYGKD